MAARILLSACLSRLKVSGAFWMPAVLSCLFLQAQSCLIEADACSSICTGELL